jgi:DNA-binding Lrp family transcriptional regulator
MFSLRGFEPRLSVQQLSRVTHASRITVRRRLERWREQGFWKGVAVYPNPDVFGAKFQMQAITLDVGRNRGPLEVAIEQCLRPFMTFQIEGMYGPLMIVRDSRDMSSRQRAFTAAWSKPMVSPPFDIIFPPSELALAPRDWKIIRALRRGAERSWVEVAQEVGVTPRGLERRVGRLMEGNSLFFHPSLDFRRLEISVAWAGLIYRKGTDPNLLWSRVQALHPDFVPLDPFFPVEKFLPPEMLHDLGGCVICFVPTPSGSSLDRLRRDFAELDGVIEVLAAFPIQNTVDPTQLDSMIEAASRRATPVAVGDTHIAPIRSLTPNR